MQAVVHPDGRLVLRGRCSAPRSDAAGCGGTSRRAMARRRLAVLPLRRVLYRADRVPGAGMRRAGGADRAD